MDEPVPTWTASGTCRVTSYLRLDKLGFSGPSKRSDIRFYSGVNVICGASDTGKSFLAEAVDFMLGGSELKVIPEREGYSAIELGLSSTEGESWNFERAISGGDFILRQGDVTEKLRQSHAHERIDNVSGFLLAKIGLLGKRILKSSAKSKTNSLSFRNLARLVIVQEGEIQQKGSPFWGGQFTLKTAELATIKLLLTGIDDSAVVSATPDEPDQAGQIGLLDELIADLTSEIIDMGEEKGELEAQLERLEISAAEHRDSVANAQQTLDTQMRERRELAQQQRRMDDRLDEIRELLARFELLREHYGVDRERLRAIQESGTLFAYVERVACPLCGAGPDAQHADADCEGNVAEIVEAATAEIIKIERLSEELASTVTDLLSEQDSLSTLQATVEYAFANVDAEIRQTMAPEVEAVRAKFTDIIETRSAVRGSLALFDRLEKLKARRAGLDDVEPGSAEKAKVAVGFSDVVAHQFSLKVEQILKAWNFPGECRVHYDKDASDFVIDGKPRGSRGKGLRAITHAAVSIALLEYCQEHELPHPGFLLLDSPLLAYFKPEGDEDTALQGTDLKERFYSYLKAHHGDESQIIIIENQHPPESELSGLNLTVFTRNPAEGRFGLL
jgi:predicted  nucleic acid-binding Zn-ribbon protein